MQRQEASLKPLRLGRGTRRCRLVVVAGLALGLGPFARAQAPTAPADLATVLTDRQLWGRDFPTALANLDLWRQVGERRVAIYHRRVVGERAYPDRLAAARPTETLLALFGAPRSRRRPTARFRDLLQPEMRRVPTPWRIEAVLLAEDDSARVAWSGEGTEFLAPELTVETVHQRLGPPQATRRRVIHTEKDSRPAVLELHEYAAGAAVFIETDLAPTPGRVDRVVLDLAEVGAALFGEQP